MDIESKPFWASRVAARPPRGLGLALLVAIVALPLTACGLTPQGDLFRGTVQTRGAEIADQTLENAHWYTCSAASIGSIKRKYGQTVESSEIYRKYCDGSGVSEANPIAPSEPAAPE